MLRLPENLKVLVIGSGGREHAICWKLAQSRHVDKIFCAPGNGGTASTDKTQNADIAVMDFAGQVQFCKDKHIDLVVVGPDDPIAAGAVDYLENEGLRVFGPYKQAAQLEASKVFSKDFMVANRIPTARYLVFDEIAQALDAVREHPWARVVKADGLALGKGVFVCDSLEDAEAALRTIFEEKRFGEAGKRVVIEEKLCGEELSLLLFSDGKQLVLMPSCQDHKRRYDGDTGPNTGGMGAYSPVNLYDACKKEIEDQVLQPIRNALQSGQLKYQGVLFIGLLVERRVVSESEFLYQPFVLEFNARFGDPETQTLLPLLKSDLTEVLWACIEGRLSDVDLEWREGASCCVVACAESYPDSSSKGQPITVNAKILPADSFVFHAGTKADGSQVFTNGGRVLAVTAVADSVGAASDLAYSALPAVSFNGMAYRKDIARKAEASCLSR